MIRGCKNITSNFLKRLTVGIDAQHYYRMVLTYYSALDFMDKVYGEVISRIGRPIDFEISIDEVATPTTPQDHFFVANELARRGIVISAIAPRFCGQFEKGIDYIGDLTQFEQQYESHALIAKNFGYKISIHSGSDKFSVFPIIGRLSSGVFHVKTAGTNWLEAVRVIAGVNPGLYRQLHAKALSTLDAARQYYVVTLNLANIPSLEMLDDGGLPALLEQDDARQVLHITYGFILQDPELRRQVYDTLIEHENIYAEYLKTHIDRHLAALGL